MCVGLCGHLHKIALHEMRFITWPYECANIKANLVNMSQVPYVYAEQKIHVC